jgi:hypothetical protein
MTGCAGTELRHFLELVSPLNWSLSCFVQRLTCLLTPWNRVLLEKLTGLHLVKQFPAFYGTRMFITAFASARHLSLSWASSIRCIPPPPTSWRSFLILSSHLHLGLPSGLFPSGFPTKILYTPLLYPVSAICPAHLILLDFITRTILGEEYRSLGFFFIVFLRNGRHYLKQVTTSPRRIRCQFTVCVFIQDILLHLRDKIKNMAVRSLLIKKISLF